MTLFQPESGYRYNSDTIFLYDFIASLRPKGELLDVGAGCGVLGLLLARDFDIALSGVEMQADLAKYAKKNAAHNASAYDLHIGDFLSMPLTKRYDYIVSNPPFYHEGVQKSKNEMIYYARYNRHLPMERFFKKVSQSLKPRSHFVFCYDPTQIALVLAALERVKLKAVTMRFVHPYKTKNASLAMIHARNGVRSMTQILPPLIVFDEPNRWSEEVRDIFKRANTNSIQCTI